MTTVTKILARVVRSSPLLLALHAFVSCQPQVPPPVASALDAAAPKAVVPSSASSRWIPVRPPGQVSLLELSARALVPPSGSSSVAAPFAGRVVRLYVQPGARVARGAPIVDFLMPEVATAAAADVAVAVRLRAYADRKQQLAALRAEGLARMEEISDVEMRLAEAQAERVRARAVLSSAGVSVNEAERIAQSGGVVTLRSPSAGIVVEVSASVGEARQPGVSPLAKVAAPGSTRVETRLGQTLPDNATFEFVPSGGTPIVVTLTEVSPVADPRDGLRLAWFDPKDARTVIATGGPGVIRVRLSSTGEAVLVPTGSIGRREGQAFVRKRVAEGSEEVIVQVMMLSGSEALVRGALLPSDAVAAEVTAP